MKRTHLILDVRLQDVAESLLNETQEILNQQVGKKQRVNSLSIMKHPANGKVFLTAVAEIIPSSDA